MNKKTHFPIALSVLGAMTAGLFSCGEPGAKTETAKAVSLGSGTMEDSLVHPDWSKNVTMYEVNLRQHTAEGTMKAFTKDIPRLKNLGVDVLWLMPIHPIGDVNRKGGENANNYQVEPGSSSPGSPYSVSDYYAVNPEFGTLQDLKALVDVAHEEGMKVILDWVANHTAFDSKWTFTNLEYFALDSADNLQPPLGTDWWDVTQLDWANGSDNGLYSAMEDALLYWVREANIDGYRCDVAMFVPTEFWNRARRALEREKADIFMLAEAEMPEHHDRAFDMSYGWHAHHVFNQVARGEFPLDSLRAYHAHEQEHFPREAYRMMFVTNHDENSWNGTIAERMGSNADAMTVLAATWMGVPLIYSGQEAGLNKRLRFFEKDTVSWAGLAGHEDFYRTLNRLHHEEEALWNGANGAVAEELITSFPEDVYAYRRVKGESEVLVALNFSKDTRRLNLPSDEATHEVVLAADGAASEGGGNWSISAHGYLILRRTN
jgi:cyclomaltodextrinase / maltogenic alpha-amylase / neopullulanase